MTLTPDNYLSLDADREFMSSHQYMNWLTCAAAEYAKLFNGWTTLDDEPEHFLVGQYVDHKLLTPENFEAWIEAHKEDVMTKPGKLRAAFVQAEKMVACLADDPIARKMLEGEHQWIVTGTIGGIPWKGMIDVIKPKTEIFVDLKTCRNCQEVMWDKDIGMRLKFYEVYGYWRQLSIYRELIRQKYDKTFLPMLLCVDKQDPPDKIALSFEDTYRLDQEIKDVEKNLPDVIAMKTGKKPATRCERCAYCRATKTLKIQTSENQGMQMQKMDW